MSYNIQMNYFDGDDYQELYPETSVKSIIDLKGNVGRPWVKFKEITMEGEYNLTGSTVNPQQETKELTNGNYLAPLEDIALGLKGTLNITQNYSTTGPTDMRFYLRNLENSRYSYDVFAYHSYNDANYNNISIDLFKNGDIVLASYYMFSNMVGDRDEYRLSGMYLPYDVITISELLTSNDALYIVREIDKTGSDTIFNFNYNFTFTLYKRPSILTYNPYLI